MIRVTDDQRDTAGVALGAIWVGNSGDERADLKKRAIGGLLNVAQDMVPRHNWGGGIEVAHVGLIDGPGNELTMYAAAVLALHALLRRHNVLVCCHSGARALTVAAMYLNLSFRRDLEDWVAVLQERVDVDLPAVNACHREAFEAMDWEAIRRMTGR